ncbi:DUF5313 family protein [Nonomuraea bangladeshensis]|uniref:DUF5313 family protein n=1 Tax=Nonomuraea bangladeshensis TaxID=404385 RepID=UPI003C30E548
MTHDVASAYERRCRLLMRLAYPPRFREFRGAELLGTLLDLAEPGQRGPGVRESFDLVRAGLMLRLREHPPPWRWLLYRVFGVRLPSRHRWWARDDIRGRFFVERYVSVVMLFWVVFLVPVESGLPYWAGLAMMCCTYLMARLSRNGLRRRWLAGHEFHPDGTSYRHFDGDTRPAS